MRGRNDETRPSPRSSARRAEVAEWEWYWLKPHSLISRVYGIIATLYRNFLIKPTLKKAIEGQFPPGSRVAHAGCGGGEIDTDLPGGLSVTALDISSTALAIYKSIHDSTSSVVRGTIFSMPLQDGILDGIYNSGVMEHFTAGEIDEILTEFHRVLKPGGKLVIFWPPRFGLSVNGLRVIHFFLNRILNKNIRLHPLEITRLRSKAHAAAILEGSHFSLLEYRFGVADFFTNCRLVAMREPDPQSER